MLKLKGFYLLRLTTCVLLLLAGIEDAYAQKKASPFVRYINRLINDTSDIAKPQLLVYPIFAYAPETSLELGLSGLYVFYAKNEITNRLSEITGLTFLTLENQYGLWLDHALYSHRNSWSVLGRIRLQSFPLLYFGLSHNAPGEELAIVDANQVQIRERVLKKIYGNLYLGMEMDFHRLSSVDFQSHSAIPFEMPLGSGGSTNLGFGTGIIYDNRHNVLNVREGFFSELAFLQYDDFWGSEYSFTSFFIDNRIYKSINNRDVLAGQLIGQFNSGNIPFNHLSLLGGESMMRGYYSGRFRDKNLIATQLEYRFLPLPLSFTKRLGATVFVSSGTVFDQFEEISPDQFVFAGGAGLRFLIFPKKDIYTRVDLAFTNEGSGLYIFVGEAF